jgi:hypothetical protein
MCFLWRDMQNDITLVEYIRLSHVIIRLDTTSCFSILYLSDSHSGGILFESCLEINYPHTVIETPQECFLSYPPPPPLYSQSVFAKMLRVRIPGEDQVSWLHFWWLTQFLHPSSSSTVVMSYLIPRYIIVAVDVALHYYLLKLSSWYSVLR